MLHLSLRIKWNVNAQVLTLDTKVRQTMTCVMFNFETPLPLAFQAPSRFLYNEENRQVNIMTNITRCGLQCLIGIDIPRRNISLFKMSNSRPLNIQTHCSYSDVIRFVRCWHILPRKPTNTMAFYTMRWRLVIFNTHNNEDFIFRKLSTQQLIFPHLHRFDLSFYWYTLWLELFENDFKVKK